MIELYLAHPFDDRINVREWQLEIEKETDIKLINPFYDVFNPQLEKLESGKSLTNKDNFEIVKRDIGLIASTDGMVSIVNNKTKYGTIQEMVYAKILGKKVYTLINNGDENHPWLCYHSDRIFEDFKGLDIFLKNLNGK